MKTTMIVHDERGLKDSEVVNAIGRAKELVFNKRGYKSSWGKRDTTLDINVGHNMYTTTIALCSKEGGQVASFYNGRFHPSLGHYGDLY